MIAWLSNLWHLIKGAFSLPSKVGMSEEEFLGLEWPYGRIEDSDGDQ